MADQPLVVEADDLLLSDSSTLINFLRIGRRDLLTRLPYRLLVTDVVRREISERYQSNELEKALAQGEFHEVSLSVHADLQAAAHLVGMGLGDGESVSIVAAHRDGALLAMDDRKAITAATRVYPTLSILTTSDIILRSIKEGALTVPEADAIKEEWRLHHRFALKLVSFQELLPAIEPPDEPASGR